MGIILKRDADDLWLSVFEWGNLLRLAETYGWIPAGTILDDPHEKWNGGYQTNDHQRVTADDARNLAGALSRALPDLPGDEKRRSMTNYVELPSTYHNSPTNPVIEGISLEDMESLTPLEWFGGEKGQESLNKYIEFLRNGEFVIR
jgi:hypothetical protein